VAEAHQGVIQLEDAPGWSVSFVVRVPAGLPGGQSKPISTPLPLPESTKIAQA
jgi:hypothetical protein